jgi:hypothetical protein
LPPVRSGSVYWSPCRPRRIWRMMRNMIQ